MQRAGVEAVITSLATPNALSEVLFGEAGATSGIEPGATLNDMSTVGCDHALEAARRLPEGVELIDAPVLARWKELLASMGTPIHVGPTGARAAMKLVANSFLSRCS